MSQWKMVKNLKVISLSGDRFSGGVLPSVIMVFLLLTVILLKMLTVYKDESEMFRQVTHYYEGKVLEELTIKQLLVDKSRNKEGEYFYNLGTVAYSIQAEKVEFDISLKSGMTYTVVEKI